MRLNSTAKHALDLARKEWKIGLASAASSDAASGYYAKLAKTYLAFGFSAAASDAFDIALSIKSDQADWFYLNGIALLNRNRCHEALVHFDHALHLNNEPLPLARKAQCWLELGDFDRASTALNRLAEIRYESAATEAMRARICFSRSQFVQAVVHLENALQLQPQADSLYRALVYAQRESGDISQVHKLSTQVGDRQVQWQDHYIDSLRQFRLPASFYIAIGHDYLGRGDNALASSAFRRAVQLGPNDVNARIAYARVLEILSDYDAAEREYLAATEIKQEDNLASYFLGMHYERQEKNHLALAQYNRAVENNPLHIPSRLYLAHALFRKNQYEAALDHYQQIIDLEPANYLASYYSALAFLMLGDCPSALAIFSSLFDNYPNAHQVKEGLARTMAVCTPEPEQLAFALSLSDQLMSSMPDSESARTMAIVYAANNDFEKATQYQRLAIRRYNADQNADRDRDQNGDQNWNQDDDHLVSLKDQLTRYLSEKRTNITWPLLSSRYTPPGLTPFTHKEDSTVIRIKSN